MTKERITRDVEAWDSQTEHRTATQGDGETSEWLADEISNVGLTPTIDEFDFARRTPVLCSIQVGGDKVEGVPFFDGGITGQWGTTTKLSLVSEGSGIVVGEFSSSGGDEDTRLLIQQRANPKVVGVVAISKMTSPGIGLLNADAYKTPYGVPVLQVDRQHREALLEAAEKGSEATLNVHFNLNLVFATNVETFVKGKKPRALAPVVIMTPKSSWWISTAERCGGVTLWLEAIRHFSENQPWRSVIFTANTGHELGHVGLDHFISKKPDLVQGAYIWLHLGANFSAVESKVRIQASDETLLQRGLEQFIPYGHTPVDQRPGGEARNIYDREGSYFSILGSNRLFHHPDDRYPENVDLNKTLELRDQFIEFADQVANER